MSEHNWWVFPILIAMLSLSACGPAPRATAGPPTAAGVTADTIIELPLSAVPAPAPRSVLSPPATAPAGAQVHVLRVLEDPRNIPLERFLSYTLHSGETIRHPLEEEIRHALEGRETSALAVYVRAHAPDDAPADDPLSFTGSSAGGAADPWTPLLVVDGVAGLRLPCAPPAVAADRSTGWDAPRPNYETTGRLLAPGELREGWLLCLSFADSTDGAALEWQFQSQEGIAYTEPGWTPLARLPLGAWHLIPNGTILGWNEEQRPASGTEGPAPPPSSFPTPTSAVPEDGVEVVYQGPVWVSIGTGLSYVRDPSVATIGAPLGNINYAQRLPGDCPAVGVRYRVGGLECTPAGEDRFGRFSLQFSFPGFEESSAQWDHLALDGRFSLELYVEDSVDGLFAVAESVEVQSEGTWVEADLPAGEPTVWAILKPAAGGNWAGPAPVWEAPLYDAAFGRVDTQTVLCQEEECFDVGELPLSESGLTDLRLEIPVPLLELGQSGHGVTPRQVRRIPTEILVNDNLHGQDFIPREMSDPWLLIDIATVNDRAQRSFLVYSGGNGEYEVAPLEMVHYFEGASGPLVVRYDAHAQTRRADEGFALLGTLPASVPLHEVFLVMANTGPAWRLE